MPKSPSVPDLSRTWPIAWVRVKFVVASWFLITWSHTRVSLVQSQERTRPDTSLLLSWVLWRLAFECGGYERKENSLGRLALQSTHYLRLVCIIFTKRQLNIICFFLVIQILGEQLKLRQQVIATATVYFKRFYARNSLKCIDPLLLAPTCVFLASKVEEFGVISNSRLITTCQTVGKFHHIIFTIIQNGYKLLIFCMESTTYVYAW